jgi:hypothetical protein
MSSAAAQDKPKGSLMDCAAIAAELGVSRAAAEKIMRQIPAKISNPDIRKVWVRRRDVEKWVEENTREDVA